MYRMRFFPIITLLCLAVAVLPLTAGEAESELTPAARLVQQLGSDDYYARQNAQNELIKMGADAYEEVREALDNPDLEIAERAKRIFTQFESESIKPIPFISDLLKRFQQETDLTQKIWHVQYLGNPIELPDAEGLPSLCRFVKFAREPAVRAEAAKVILTSPPLTPTLRRRWYQTVKKVIGQPQNDVVLRMLADYISAFEIADRIATRLESGAQHDENATDREALRKATLRFAETLTAFRAVPENMNYMPGSASDILLCYALAELREAAGMPEEADRSVAEALAIRSEKPASMNPYLVTDLHAISAWAFHLEAGVTLLYRGRLAWAEREFQQILDHLGLAEFPVDAALPANRQEAILQWRTRMIERLAPNGIDQLQEKQPIPPAKASNADEPPDEQMLAPFVLLRYADLCVEKDQFDAAIVLTTLAIPQVDTLSQRGLIMPEKAGRLSARVHFYRAKRAAADDDWKQVHADIKNSLERDTHDVDALILRWQLQRHLTDLPEEYRQETDRLITAALDRIRGDILVMRDDTDNSSRWNEYAWLASNTGREPEMSEYCIAMALKRQPENWAYLDTQAHVFAAAGDLKKAVETQMLVVRRNPERNALAATLQRFQEELEQQLKP